MKFALRFAIPLLSVIGICAPLSLSSCSSADSEPRRLSYGGHEAGLVQEEEGETVGEWEGILVIEPFATPPEAGVLEYWQGKDDPERVLAPVYEDAIRNRGPALPCDGVPVATDFGKATLFLVVEGALEQVRIYANPCGNDAYALSWAFERNSEENPAEDDVFWFSCHGLLSFPGPGWRGFYRLLFRRDDGTWARAIPYESAFLSEE